MKISFNLKPQSGPFGGGNSFLANIIDALQSYGFKVEFDLDNPDIDFIFLIDPRWRHPLMQYNIGEISRYILRNPDSLVIHRINECDERKNTNVMNKKINQSNYLADCTIFVSNWLRDLNFLSRENERRKFDKVIRNGSDTRVFFSDPDNYWRGKSPLKLVTHHWSANPMKGFDLYKHIDDLLGKENLKEKIEFTYIGNVHPDYNFVNTKVISPLSGEELAQELRRHHVYVTGSLNEPGGNHQNEGALSGLPLIYIDSGSMKEYCEGFGIELKNALEFESALQEMLVRYRVFKDKINSYPNTAEKMTTQYIQLLNLLELHRPELVESRKLFRSPKSLLRLQFPI